MKTKQYVTCVVKACHGSDITSSSSGLLFDHEGGVVLTHSTVLLPHLSRSNLTLSSKSLDDEISFSIIIEKDPCLPDGSRDKQSTKKGSVLTLKADFVGSFRCKQFEDDLLKMMPQNQGWKFSETPQTINVKNSSETRKSGLPDDESESFFFHMLPEFVILHIKNFKLHKNYVIYRKLALLPSSKLAIGDNLYVLGTPFGDSSPHIFINSVSKGVLSNQGSEGGLLLTDARCIPGEEGGIVFTDHIDSKDMNQRFIIGMVVVPLCWKAGEWVGLSLVCDIIYVLSSLVKKFPKYDQIYSNAFADGVLSQPSMTCIPIAVRSSCCVFVRCSIHWGSGLLLDSRTLLTCSHVVQGSKTVIVHIDGKIIRGRTIYTTPAGDPFDLAVVSLDLGLRGGYESLKFAESMVEGEDVFSIGYALFDESCLDTPTVTKGIVSKVNYVDGLPVMIQTDCVINQGASGGLITRPNGEIMGIVACNCRDAEMKASYPHVNLAIPAMTIMPVVNEYLRTRDVGVLAKLHVTSPAVQRLWSVDLTEQRDLKSKL